MKHSVKKPKPTKRKTSKAKTVRSKSKTGGGRIIDSLKLAYILKKTKIPKK